MVANILLHCMNGTYSPVTREERLFHLLFYVTGDMFEDDSNSSTNEESGMQFVFCTNVTLTPDQNPEQLEVLMIPIRLEADNGTGIFTEVSTDMCRASINDDDGKLLYQLSTVCRLYTASWRLTVSDYGGI